MSDEPLLVALRELGDRLSAVDVPQRVIEAFPSLSNLQGKLFTTVIVGGLATGTSDSVMCLEPSNLLLEMTPQCEHVIGQGSSSSYMTRPLPPPQKKPTHFLFECVRFNEVDDLYKLRLDLTDGVW